MGVWALEFNPGVAGPIYKMFYFNGDVFGVNYAGAGGAGVWRRTPPNWTRHFAAGGPASGKGRCGPGTAQFRTFTGRWTA